MKNRKKRARAATPGVGIDGAVVRVLDGRVAVRTTLGEIVGHCAVSCLLEPEVGDHVLVVDDGTTWWVIAILERPGCDDRTISVRGKLTLEGERVHVTAKDDVRLAGSNVSLVGKALEMAGVSTKLLFERLGVRGVAADFEVNAARVVASTVDTIADRVSERLRSAFRFVAGRDQLRAEHIDHAAEKNAVLRGENAVVTGEDLVKVDGKQIHVG